MEKEIRIKGTFSNLWRLADNLNHQAQKEIYTLLRDDDGASHIRLFVSPGFVEHGRKVVSLYEIFNVCELDGYTTICVKTEDDEPNYAREWWDKLNDAMMHYRLLDGQATPGKPGKCKRGISSDVLDDCKKAMEYWLDQSKTLKVSAELVSRDDETVLAHIPDVLKIANPQTRDKWIVLIKAQGKGKYLERS